MLTDGGESARYVYNGLNPDFTIDKVLLTTPRPKSKMIERRIKKLGLLTVINQLFFQVFVVNSLKIFSKKAMAQRKKELHLEGDGFPPEKIVEVGSVNSSKTITGIEKLQPDIIIVCGTTIISKKVLKSTTAPFINIHTGITPQYRGVHGGYWALYNDDKENFGVTVHKIDAGIDTGDIIYQDTAAVKEEDNFLTYPLIQTALAVPLLKKTIRDIKNNQLKTYRKDNAISKLYYHPTATQYLGMRIKRKVK